MYAYMCLYVHCIALSAAIAAQQFWNDVEFCQNLNLKHINDSSVGVTTNVDITRIKCKNTQTSRDGINMLDHVQILCREYNSLTYFWNNTIADDIITVVEFMSYNTNDTHLILETNSSYIRIDNLKSNTEYMANFRTLINDTTYNRINTTVITTLDDSLKPDPVHSVQVSNLYTENSGLEALLTWKPSKDMNCYYRITFYPNKQMETPRMGVVDILEYYYNFVLTPLTMDTEYTVTVESFNNLNTSFTVRSNKTSYVFNTPSCLNISHYDPDLCPPMKPYNVTVTEVASRGGDRYDIRISWKYPVSDGRGGAHHFKVKLENEAKIVPGTVNDVYFDNVTLHNRYLAGVQAFSLAGNFSETVKWSRVQQATDDSRDYYLWTTSLAIITFSVFFSAVGMWYVRRRTTIARDIMNKAAAAVEVTDTYGGCDVAVLQGLNDVDMLLYHKNVIVSDVLLGHGHFGVVKKGTLKTDGGELPVAIKSLRDHANGRDLEEFFGEIVLMQKVGKHPNIVSMIGCCLDADKRCTLVVEYCPLGDLQTYLRKVNIKSRYANNLCTGRTDPVEFITANSKEVELLQNTINLSPSMVFNNCYLYHGEENLFLTVNDLMCFASQVANGMVFLEKNRIVHRDLAARNVLLSDHRTIKICDFGLSRDVYEQNHYQKSNCGDPLPVKWMALESLKYRVYTTQSDVWSFGVLLWEIMMLGGSPYPTISSSKLYEVLSRGYRMPKPTLCCHGTYEVMLACWHSNPANRPKFGQIKNAIDSIMENQY